jgi:hypothetical protein
VSKQYKQSGKRMARIARGVLAVGALSLALGAASAEAGRRTAQPPADGTSSSVGPVTPEPAAGLAFAIGVGIVARSLRRPNR